MDNKLIIKVIVGLFIALIGVYLLMIEPSNLGDRAGNEYSKPRMEKYLEEKGLSSVSIGSSEWDYYVNVIGPETEEIYCKTVYEATKVGAAIFAVILLIIGCMPTFSYQFGVISNLPILILVAGGFTGVLLIPLLMYCLLIFLRDKLLKSISTAQ